RCSALARRCRTPLRSCIPHECEAAGSAVPRFAGCSGAAPRDNITGRLAAFSRVSESHARGAGRHFESAPPGLQTSYLFVGASENVNWRRSSFGLWLVITTIWFVVIGTWASFAWHEETQTTAVFYNAWEHDRLLQEKPSNLPRDGWEGDEAPVH